MLVNNLKPGWKNLVNQEAQKPYFKDLCQFLNHERKNHSIYPCPADVLRVLQETDIEQIKVVILGQDPYHGEGQAIGRSFAVPDHLQPKPPSLKNIMKEVESDLGAPIDNPKSDLNGWVKQGVFLFNTVLTVRSHQAHSHRNKGWETFSDQIIRRLNDKEVGIVFLLWGAAAQKKAELITSPQHFLLRAPHPSPLSAHRGFFGCRHFSNANTILKQKLGLPPIDWLKT